MPRYVTASAEKDKLYRLLSAEILDIIESRDYTSSSISPAELKELFFDSVLISFGVQGTSVNDLILMSLSVADEGGSWEGNDSSVFNPKYTFTTTGRGSFVEQIMVSLGDYLSEVAARIYKREMEKEVPFKYPLKLDPEY